MIVHLFLINIDHNVNYINIMGLVMPKSNGLLTLQDLLSQDQVFQNALKETVKGCICAQVSKYQNVLYPTKSSTENEMSPARVEQLKGTCLSDIEIKDVEGTRTFTVDSRLPAFLNSDMGGIPLRDRIQTLKNTNSDMTLYDALETILRTPEWSTDLRSTAQLLADTYKMDQGSIQHVMIAVAGYCKNQDIQVDAFMRRLNATVQKASPSTLKELEGAWKQNVLSNDEPSFRAFLRGCQSRVYRPGKPINEVLELQSAVNGLQLISRRCGPSFFTPYRSSADVDAPQEEKPSLNRPKSP